MLLAAPSVPDHIISGVDLIGGIDPITADDAVAASRAEKAEATRQAVATERERLGPEATQAEVGVLSPNARNFWKRC